MSLLLDALKQAADKKQKSDNSSDSSKAADGTKEATNIKDDDSQANEITADEIKLELEEIQDDLEHETDATSENASINTNDENAQEKISSEYTTEEKSHEESTVEMDQFDPDSPISEPPESISEDLGDEQEICTEQSIPKTKDTSLTVNGTENSSCEKDDKSDHREEISTSITSTLHSSNKEKQPENRTSQEADKSKNQDTATKNNDVKTKGMAPENAKIIVNQKKKKPFGTKLIIAGLLLIAIIAAGAFLGYLHYIDQDSQISTNIASLSRQPKTVIKPIDDLSTASNEITQEIFEESKEVQAANTNSNQLVSGTISDTTINGQTKPTDTDLNQDISSSKEITPAIIQEEHDSKSTPDQQAVKTTADKPVIESKENQIAAEEMPPTLSSVVNSHPFIQATPLEKSPVQVKPAIQITKNSKQTYADQSIANGYKAFNSAKYQAAKLEYNKALKFAPNSVDALLGLGAIALIEEDKVTAKRFYKKVLDLNPQNTTAINAISAMNNNIQANETTYKQSIAENTNNPWAYFNLGNYYLDQQDWSKALFAFKQANQIAPNSPDIVYNIGIALDNLDRIKPAIAAYKKAVNLANYKTASFDVYAVSQYIESLSQQLKSPANSSADNNK